MPSNSENQEAEPQNARLGLKYFLYYATICVMLAVALYSSSMVILRKFHQYSSEECESLSSDEVAYKELKTAPPKRLKYWKVSIVEWNENGNLRSMDRVFEKLGYEFVNASLGDDWDILWSKEHPYKPRYFKHPVYPLNETKLKVHQKINHIPGNGALICKSQMSTINNGSKYILPAFRYNEIDALKYYASNNPQKQFVKKNINNRGVRIVSADEISDNYDMTFYQVFLDKPFLVDGHAFDFGVFVLITSIDPLRIYRFSEEVLMRFCPEKYYPFDKNNRAKYVVEDNHLTTYEMRLFNETYMKYKFAFKSIFEDYVESQGFSVRKMWQQIDDAIAKIILSAKDAMVQELYDNQFASKNFFELVRFDFMFDENMNAYVMEVNMSPNMTPISKKFEKNSIIYEQIIYNVVMMIGGGSYFEFMGRFNNDTTIVQHKNIAVDAENCIKHDCANNCKIFKCRLCLPCIKESMLYEILEAYREHLHQGNFVRVFPRKIHFNDYGLRNELEFRDNLMMDWYKKKCARDVKWC